MSEPSLGKPWSHEVEEVADALGADLVRGLSGGEAEDRLRRFGQNALDESPPEPVWRRILRQVQDPLTLLLLVAAALSFLAWLYERETSWPYEGLTVLAVVVLNAVLAVVQEGRAERALLALADLTPPSALVLRDGIPSPIPAALVVPGDLLLLEEGQAIAADARVVEATGLRAIESALTGESTPVSKQSAPADADALADRVSMVFAGSAVAGGRGRAVVTATGMATELGRIAGLLQETPQERTPLQRELDRMGRFLGRAVLVLAAVVTLSLLLAGQGEGTHAFLDVLLVGIALAVAAVPEGLTAICTIVLSLGTERMARRRAVVRRLTAVEALGSATVICSDKTGTLTRNEMTVRALLTAAGRVDFTGVGYDPSGEILAGGRPLTHSVQAEEARRALEAGVLANNAVLVLREGSWVVRGDPTEGALLVAARKAGLDEAALALRFPRRGEVPFSSERKLMSTVHAAGEALWVASKGAPDVLLARCSHELVGGEERPLGPERRERILAGIEALAGEALRPLGLAHRARSVASVPAEGGFGPQAEQDLAWLGAVGMIDPPRPEAKAAVRLAREAGIRTVMITGDHPRTAAAIAAELGLCAPGEMVLRGTDIRSLDDRSLRAMVSRTAVYARVSPEDKLRIVLALQREGHVVAMTGDGVNDAPALKKADIGVAMGLSGTDVSKSAADMVLLDDNYATIVAAVEEGRAIYENIQKFLRYLLSSNAGEVMTMFLGVVGAGALGLYLDGGRLVVPLVPTMILWMNLLTDALPALALGLDPPAPDVMRRPPRDPRTEAITPRMWLDIAGIGTVMAVCTLGVMDLALPGGFLASSWPGPGGPERAQTLAFTTLVFFQLWNVFATRSEEKTAFAGLFTNPWLWLAVLCSLALQVLAVSWGPLQRAFGTVGLSLGEWGLCLTVSSVVVWLGEVPKRWRRRGHDGTPPRG